jgi:hypothetical protein
MRSSTSTRVVSALYATTSTPTFMRGAAYSSIGVLAEY